MPRTPPLDEPSHRKPDFQDGIPVEMADGQVWYLARPLVEFSWDSGPDGMKPFLVLGDDFQDLLDAVNRAAGFERDLAAATDQDKLAVMQGYDGPSAMAAALAIGERLLRANYDLTDEEVGRVLRMGLGGRGQRVLDSVMQVAWGNVPKAPGGGSAPA
jgi:hypothetical protein